MGLRVDGLSDLRRTMYDLNSEVMEHGEMNRKRAVAFKKYTTGAVGGGNLRLKKITKATKKIQGKDHHPMRNEGEMLRAIKVRKFGMDYETGFFADDASKPSPRTTTAGYTSRPKLTWYKIALIQHAGYSIPVSWNTDKGRRVRRWLMLHGIFMRRARQFIEVPPRPIITKSMRQYEKAGRDMAVANKHFNKIWDKV